MIRRFGGDGEDELVGQKLLDSENCCCQPVRVVYLPLFPKEKRVSGQTCPKLEWGCIIQCSSKILPSRAAYHRQAMSRRDHIDRIMRDWPYDPNGISVRKRKGNDGRDVLQMRLDL